MEKKKVREHDIHVRLNSSEYIQLYTQAKQKHLTVSTFARQLIFESIEKEKGGGNGKRKR